MRQQERIARSRTEILQAARTEFGTQDYSCVSVEQICARYHISKGMFYHYYAGKDPLFLACVEQVFQTLAQLSLQLLNDLADQPPLARVQGYFSARERYFAQHPLEKKLFESALLHTPAHLNQQIQQLRTPLIEANRRFFLQVTEGLDLRPGLKREQVLLYLESVEQSFWDMMRYCCQASDAQAVSSDQWRGFLLDFILFGVLQS